MLKALTASIYSVAFPQSCKVCGDLVEDLEDGVVCRTCWQATHIFDGREILCSKCGAVLGKLGGPRDVSCHKCGDQHYDKASAVGIYEQGIAASCLHLKIAPELSKFVTRSIKDALDRNPIASETLVIPVPLSPKRRLERGFNQAETIAEVVARHTGCPLDSHSLVRTRHTPMHRVAMDRRARELTVEKAFDVVRPKFIAGRDVLLVDDIFTSGSTVSACAKVLKKNGAARVDVFTLARATVK